MAEQSKQKEKLLKEALGTDPETNEVNLSPEKIADPINKDLKNRYQGLMEEEELDTLKILESNEIIKELDSGKPISEIDVDQLVVDSPFEKILGIFSSNTLNLNREFPSISSLIISPIPVALLTLVSGIIFIKKKDAIFWYLLGEDGLLEQITEKLGLAKPKVSDTSIFLHNRNLETAKIFAKSAKSVDNTKLSKDEFLLFAKIKFCLEHDREEYEGIKESISLFKSAMKAQKSYVIISELESAGQGIKQKEFYDYAERTLENFDDSETFKEQINKKIIEILPQVKTEEGKEKLRTYATEILNLSEDIFSVQLFCVFKKQELKDFLVLKSINENITNLQETDVVSLKALTCLVMANYDDFEALGDIIDVKGKKSNPDTYAKIIQYIALGERHKNSYGQFEQLINVMRQWYPIYQKIKDIREEYPRENYRQPKDFIKPIPGIDLYNKYRNYLTDQNTGSHYVDFGEEMESATT
ncbi:hypothetical protein [Crocosphaera sp.]|uniref:hypothetical protein n=1 Tax=Crocosphaera sp. TaxID=2729996 RepID=UPI00257D3B9F|nr:hypothetical protein [Crocosphaera sp.]NQZ61095.1 hypothetical protein [Crocosphaera sp.]